VGGARGARFPDPFLLPVCSCGGPTSVSWLAPDLFNPDVERRTYRCGVCGSERTYLISKDNDQSRAVPLPD
jgi:hypothetical protein